MNELAPPEPTVHYTDFNYPDHSPCGDKGRATIVTDDYELVTCEKCLKVLRAKMN